MTAAATIALAPPPPTRFGAAWLALGAALLLLYVPTHVDIAATFWRGDVAAHGGVVIAMWLWLVWREREHLIGGEPTRAGAIIGWTAVALGAVAYALGRSQQMFQLEAGSQLAILPGIALIVLGPRKTRRLWFIWLFLAFTVPVPGSLVDSLLVPMKELVSAAVTEVLYHAGLPIARDGVVIYAGHYQLFIADACSGLNQLVSLTAVGLLYARVTGPRTVPRTAVLIAAILPIAVTANLLRVTALVLATWYGGDGLGRQLHDAVSYAEIAIAFGSFFALDRIVRVVWPAGAPRR